ncbi:MAG TPA: alpha/beta hydrolase-fold protein [Candidatus Dormibacteraeota bacterium]|nr:alpha/beta hydrolase-fold protein [Candidatus Dormibacteraeota bacterium]
MAFWLTDSRLAPNLVAAPLTALGLDPERALFSSALASAFIASAAGAVFTRSVLSWLAGAAWFAVLYLLPVVLRGLPPPVSGQRLDAAGTVTAGLAQVALALAVAGLGAAAGRGLRAATRAGLADLRSGDRRRAVRTIVALALLALACFGLWQAPGMLLYGPWQAAYQAEPGLATRQVLLAYHSEIFGIEQQAVVILPPGYDRSPATRYPVLYLLHGWPGSARDWPNQGAGDIAAAAAAAHQAPAMIVVSPDGNGPRGGAGDSWADDYVPGDRAESSFLQELIPAVSSHFRVLGDRDHQALGGLSSGGYGAVNIALRHPGLFVLAIDLAGDVVPPAKSFGGNQPLQQANSPLLLAARPRPAGAGAFFIGWGAQDGYAAQNQRLAEQLQASGYPVSTAVARGGHQWSAWTTLLAEGLRREGDLIGQPASG